MAAVRRSIEPIIESDPTMRTGLQQGIVNSRAVSRYILENCGIDSTPNAVLGILGHYPLNGIGDDGNRLGLEDCSTMRSTRGENFRVIMAQTQSRDSRPRSRRQYQTEFSVQRDYQPHPDLAENLSPTSIRNGETGQTLLPRLSLN